MSVLGLTAVFVRHARPGTGVGSSRCRIHTEINSSERGEASGRTSPCAPLRLGMTSSVTDSFHKPWQSGHRHFGPGQAPSPPSELCMWEDGSGRGVHSQTSSVSEWLFAAENRRHWGYI